MNANGVLGFCTYLLCQKICFWGVLPPPKNWFSSETNAHRAFFGGCIAVRRVREERGPTSLLEQSFDGKTGQPSLIQQ